MKNLHAIRVCLLSAAFYSVWAMPVLAQSPESIQPAADESPDPLDIIVTARRSEESLQKVPLAVTAFTPNDIIQKNIVGPQDLALIVPSLSVTTSNVGRDSSNYTIRGQGGAPIPGVEPTVVTYFDQVATTSQNPGSVSV